MKKLLTIIFAVLIFAGIVFPQMSVIVSIENQQAVGNDFFFDLYLRTSQASDSLFLGNSDFVLTFDVSNFSSPVFTLEGELFTPMFCTFVPRVAGGATGTREDYSEAISVILNGNQLTINLGGPEPSSLTFFNNRVARIDNSESTHRLGRFKVSGISNLSGFMNLQWVSAIVATLDPTPPDFNELPTDETLQLISNTPLPIVEVEVVPTQFELSQNYPNPFNPTTTIQFSLPQASQLKISVYNMIGEQVATIADGLYESGYHKVLLDAANLSSGTYIYRLESSDFVQVKKMILLK